MTRRLASGPAFSNNGVVKYEDVPGGDHLPPQESDASTRDRVARSILQHGPSTAAQLADRLGLTAAAVRRHLTVLMEVGRLSSREQRIYGQRGRGRPAKVFCLTDAGRAEFYQAYDQLAIGALHYLGDHAGPDAVAAFADATMAGIARRFAAQPPEYGEASATLVQVLNDEGYVASLQPVATGQQLCQYHCPVSHVAKEFPELCAAETRVFSRLLGTHVQRLATIAHGDGVCTTHIPHPVNRKVDR